MNVIKCWNNFLSSLEVAPKFLSSAEKTFQPCMDSVTREPELLQLTAFSHVINFRYCLEKQHNPINSITFPFLRYTRWWKALGGCKAYIHWMTELNAKILLCSHLQQIINIINVFLCTEPQNNIPFALFLLRPGVSLTISPVFGLERKHIWQKESILTCP